MKIYFLFLIVALLFSNSESNTYNLQIKDILTQDVCSYGIFVLDAELNMPIKDALNIDSHFKLYVRNSKSVQAYTECFLMHFPGVTTAKVGCYIPGVQENVFQIVPVTETGSYTLYGHTINILPYSIKQPFSVKAGLELYYYTPYYEIKKYFLKKDEISILEFYLFSKTSSQDMLVYLDKILIECRVNSGIKLVCPVIAKGFVQERNHIYEANLIDTNKKIKKNYFVNPIEIILEYIKE